MAVDLELDFTDTANFVAVPDWSEATTERQATHTFFNSIITALNDTKGLFADAETAINALDTAITATPANSQAVTAAPGNFANGISAGYVTSAGGGGWPGSGTGLWLNLRRADNTVAAQLFITLTGSAYVRGHNGTQFSQWASFGGQIPAVALADSPASYPTGVSSMAVLASNSWPLDGNVFNTKTSDTVMVQVLRGNSTGETLIRQYTGGAWTTFRSPMHYMPVNQLTASRQLAQADHNTVLTHPADASSAKTVTLPNGNNVKAGFWMFIDNASPSYAVNLTAASGASVNITSIPVNSAVVIFCTATGVYKVISTDAGQLAAAQAAAASAAASASSAATAATNASSGAVTAFNNAVATLAAVYNVLPANISTTTSNPAVNSQADGTWGLKRDSDGNIVPIMIVSGAWADQLPALASTAFTNKVTKRNFGEICVDDYIPTSGFNAATDDAYSYIASAVTAAKAAALIYGSVTLSMYGRYRTSATVLIENACGVTIKFTGILEPHSTFSDYLLKIDGNNASGKTIWGTNSFDLPNIHIEYLMLNCKNQSRGVWLSRFDHSNIKNIKVFGNLGTGIRISAARENHIENPVIAGGNAWRSSVDEGNFVFEEIAVQTDEANNIRIESPTIVYCGGSGLVFKDMSWTHPTNGLEHKWARKIHITEPQFHMLDGDKAWATLSESSGTSMIDIAANVSVLTITRGQVRTAQVPNAINVRVGRAGDTWARPEFITLEGTTISSSTTTSTGFKIENGHGVVARDINWHEFPGHTRFDDPQHLLIERNTDDRKPLWIGVPLAGSSTPSSLGNSIVNVGTVSHPTPTLTDYSAGLPKSVYTGTAGANQSAGLRNGGLRYVRGNSSLPFGRFRLRVQFGLGSDATGFAGFFGLINTGSNGLNNNTPSGLTSNHLVGVGFDDTDATSGNFSIYTNDASGTPTKIATALARSITKMYEVIIESQPTRNRVLVELIDLTLGKVIHREYLTSDLPAHTTYMSFAGEVSSRAVTGTAPIVNFAYGEVLGI